jgi:hypothetical protein
VNTIKIGEQEFMVDAAAHAALDGLRLRAERAEQERDDARNAYKELRGRALAIESERDVAIHERNILARDLGSTHVEQNRLERERDALRQQLAALLAYAEGWQFVGEQSGADKRAKLFSECHKALEAK